jgi:hypothetical protein
MGTKIRKQIYLDPEQNNIIAEMSGRLGISEAQVIRQAIMLQGRRIHSLLSDRKAWRREMRFIRSLMKRGRVSGGRTWRREELHER